MKNQKNSRPLFIITGKVRKIGLGGAYALGDALPPGVLGNREENRPWPRRSLGVRLGGLGRANRPGRRFKKVEFSLSSPFGILDRRLSGHMQATPPPPKDCPFPFDQNPKASP